MKSLGGPGVNSGEIQKSMPPETFYNLDATLAAEGFPIRTIVELNDFEIKLRKEPKYREKMVSAFVRLSVINFISCMHISIEIDFISNNRSHY